MTESSTASVPSFNRSGTQVVTSGGTVSNAINYTVNSGSTLQPGRTVLAAVPGRSLLEVELIL